MIRSYDYAMQTAILALFESDYESYMQVRDDDKYP